MRKREADILWLAILLSLTVVMGGFLISGDILLYLAPRMVPIVWFGFAGLAVLFGYQTWQFIRSLREKRETNRGKFGIVLFLVPVLLLLTAMPNDSTPGSLPNQSVKMLSLGDKGAQTEEAAASAETEDVSGFLPCVLEEETAVFRQADDSFVDYLRETAEELAGKTVTVFGFVYTDDTFPENMVLVSRMMISCCAADASIVGFHVKVQDSAELTDNEWIRVTGTIQIARMPYYGTDYDFPILTDGIIVHCETPRAEDTYIYP